MHVYAPALAAPVRFAWSGHATVALPVFKLLRKLGTYACIRPEASQTDAPKRCTTLNRCLSIPPKAKAHETMLETICTSYVNILVLHTRANQSPGFLGTCRSISVKEALACSCQWFASHQSINCLCHKPRLVPPGIPQCSESFIHIISLHWHRTLRASMQESFPRPVSGRMAIQRARQWP